MTISGRRCALITVGLSVLAAVVLLTAVPQARPAKDPDSKGATAKAALVGHIEAEEQTQMYARVVGFVQKVHVDIGDHVKKGQLLVELAVPEMEADLKQKDALVEQTEIQFKHAQLILKESQAALTNAAAQIKEAEAGVKTAQAKLDETKAAHERAKKLLSEGLVDVKDVEVRASQVEVARAGLEEAKIRLQTAQTIQESGRTTVEGAEIGIKSASAQRDVARAEAQRAAVMVNYAKVVAPFDGVITQRTVDVGTLAGPPGAHGEPLFVVSRVDKVRAVFLLPQEQMARIKVGAEVSVQALGQEFKGKVARTAGAIDPARGTLRVEADLANTDGKLLPGMSITVMLP
jgi:HlyD family secretion protein